jgi:hypothetical protein
MADGLTRDACILDSAPQPGEPRSDAGVPSHTFADPSIGVPAAMPGRVDYGERKRTEEEPKEFAPKWQPLL